MTPPPRVAVDTRPVSPSVTVVREARVVAVVEFAVVVDTNVFENGEFSNTRFQKLAKRVEKKGHTLIVPAVVVWEWAEHAHAAHELYRSQARYAARRIDSLFRGAIEVPAPSDVEELVAAIFDAVIATGAGVADPPDGSAVDAVRQQVLQIGHGVKSEKVKTGAADALLAATVESIADERGGAILVSADERLTSLVHDPPRVRVVKRLPDLWKLLIAVAPAEAVVVERFTKYALDSINAELAEGKSPLPTGRPHYDQAVSEALDLNDDSELFDLTLHEVLQVEALEPEVVQDDDVRFLSAELVVVGFVGAFSWRIAGPDAELVHDYGEAELRITLTATADLDEEFNPISFELDGPVTLQISDTYWNERAEEDEFEGPV